MGAHYSHFRTAPGTGVRQRKTNRGGRGLGFRFGAFCRQWAGFRTAEAIGIFAAGVKTNAVRILDRLGIAYELRTYEVDPDDLSAATVAAKVGLPLEQVWKTLVARGDRHGELFAVLPGDAELDLKALARMTGDRKVDTVALKEVQPLTGYIRGGVTVFGARKPFPVFVDETVELHDRISVSAGVRGMQILLAPSDYLRAARARVCDIARSG